MPTRPLDRGLRRHFVCAQRAPLSDTFRLDHFARNGATRHVKLRAEGPNAANRDAAVLKIV